MIETYKDSLDINGRLNEEQIRAAISWKSFQNPDIDKQKKYYNGKNAVTENSKHEHKIPAPFGRKLLKTVSGFMFKEGLITYKFPDDKRELKDYITEIFDCNDEESENAELGKDQSCFGAAYEAVFINNNDAHIQFRRLDAKNIIPIYSEDLGADMIAAINFYTKGRGQNTTKFVEIYYKDIIQTYQDNGERLILVKEVRHFFKEVPIIEYKNNEEGLGDIEPIIALIDAHDESLSTAFDEDDKFADAILAIKNFDLDDEAVELLQKARILRLPDETAAAEYLVKPEVFQGREILRSTIEKLIHSLSGIPKLDDKGALNAESGEAMKYLYATFEMIVAGEKQSKFINGLQKRLRLITNFATWLGVSSCGSNGIEIEWARNLPSEFTTIIDNANKVRDGISQHTYLEQLQKANIIEDVDKEIERLIAESNAALTKELKDPYDI